MNTQSQPLGPILTADLLLKVESKLIELLKSLSEDEWEFQTVAPKWKVKDVAAHLLDTHLRKLSIARDGYVGERPAVEASKNLAEFINRLNEEGVRMYRRLSPRVLISLMEMAGRESAAYHQSLDPFAPAPFAVSWAGDTVSPNWFDTARELTERWHHQQQIRLAVNRPGLMTRELYHPVLDCFLRALPFRYRTIAADRGAVLKVEVPGGCGGTWYLEKDDLGWRLVDRSEAPPVSRVIIPEEIAWRIFTKGIEYAEAGKLVRIEGDRELGIHVLSTVSIVA
ncbi:MAG: maleylpyruvate isomerase N-terminal domain-containing protein [Bryobacteraceae bacterium]